MKMTASTSKLKTQACSDKNYYDEKKGHDVNSFPVNFSGVPHIGQKIFEILNFKDLDNCRTVCKDWLNFLGENRSLWIKLLEKEEIKLESDLHSLVNLRNLYVKYAENWEHRIYNKMKILKANRAGTVVYTCNQVYK